jgi:putative two-component system response regulator
VDDDAGNLAILGDLLRPHYNILAAPSGERALQIAAGSPRPDLILLDVQMPEMDGYAVLARLREDPATSDIPVIFVTGLDSVAAEEKGLELGAADYITKPYRPPRRGGMDGHENPCPAGCAGHRTGRARGRPQRGLPRHRPADHPVPS